MRAYPMVCLLGLLCLAGCGGGGGGSLASSGGGPPPPPSGSNVAALVVDNGPTAVAKSNTPAINTLYTSVTVCVPGTNTCQTIDHVEVDTGSMGLRLMASLLQSNLPMKKDSSGNVVGECTQFVDGSSWGTLRLADIKIAGEVASNQAIQVIDDSGHPAYPIPSTCTGTAENSVSAFGANGILGVGPFLQDCGPPCTTTGNNVYYTCPSTNTPCTSTATALTEQLTNPVASFATDNNGVMIQVGSVSSTAASVSGSLIFGIGTGSNNGLGSAKVFTLDGSGELRTSYAGMTLTSSFIDSGSNAYYFPDSSIPTCANNSAAPGFFCPNSTLALSATITGLNGISSAVNFNVANAVGLLNTGSTIAAAAVLGAPSTTVADDGTTFNGSDTFDWGLPFYFGRTVYTAIESQNTSAGMGPYFAF